MEDGARKKGPGPVVGWGLALCGPGQGLERKEGHVQS